MKQSIVTVALVVPDYDEAIAFFTGVLGFELLEDTPQGPGKRFVRVGPKGGNGAALLLARAANDEQRAAIGNQTGGRVFLFLHTDDFDRDYGRLAEAGVEFTGTPRDEPYGKVVVFLDPYGNKWDLVQPAG
jgi:catechol 2,3-dioxygenase-like lactoylglutathione lyase family enzyme